ncbi:MAG: hypothetical protein JRJ62_00150 [Deltaproteobacteria bacterium]|nr:hypothetical protein [Deltaproteobacteria bacterium]
MSAMVQNTANTATGVAVASGMYGFVSENAPVFGIFLTMLSIIIATIFYMLNYRINRQRLMITIEDSERGIKQNISDDELKMLKQWCDRRR